MKIRLLTICQRILASKKNGIESKISLSAFEGLVSGEIIWIEHI